MYNNNFPVMHPHYWQNDSRNVQNVCQRYMNYHVMAQMSDGSQVEGIIEDMDDEGVTMLVPEVVEDHSEMDRIYGGFGGYGDYGYGGYGGYGRRRFRRYLRRHYPYYSFVFPFIVPFPYYY